MPTIIRPGQHIISVGGPRIVTSRGGGAYDPTSIEGCLQLMQADALTGLNDGDGLAVWTDQSGLGNDSAQPSASNQPIYKTGIMNGLPAVQYADGVKYMVTTGLNPTNAWTMFWVIKPSSTSVWGLIDTAPFSAYTVRNMDVNEIEWRHQHWAAGVNLGLADTSPIILTLESSKPTNVQLRLWQNESLQDSHLYGYSGDVLWNSNFAIGAINHSTPAYSGYIGERILYDHPLADEDRAAVQSYLISKWGIS